MPDKRATDIDVSTVGSCDEVGRVLVILIDRS